ncbi:hypothetical protein H257_14315 [Aphanomyces astaci]|uniref:Amino acid permease/ SLC12A domain-containing protein n=1 Tax=Aphanomyces astaci TaxID=112090 RepID=W4FRN0_APHAT|nr:hypothetical protein H257_14315 [Aphanomyces astaci]ETV70150.1 hypothetical protein H257_14315 [Aphanomyces astaci]|eukprot:XP_009840381.1 hypothetical protein H257_14315 [Aphanomyces astaci]
MGILTLSRTSITPTVSIKSFTTRPATSLGPTAPADGCKVVEINHALVDPTDKATTIHVWALGIVAVIGGQFYGWNVSFGAGFLPFFLSFVMMGAAYIIYVACVSEVGGKVPGGSYGLARAVLGYYPGFLLSSLELLEYTSFASVSVLYVTEFATTFFNWNEDYQPILWLLFYAVFIFILESRGKYVWWFMLVFVVLCLAPTVLFVCGSLSYVNFQANAILVDDATNETTWATGDISSAFFGILPSTTVGFAGVESLTVVTGFVKDPAVAVPKGTVAAVWTLFVSNIALILVLASLPPGLATTSTDEYFLDRGLSLGLGMSSGLSEWLMMPAQMGMAFGFFIPYARLTQAMADSNLLPSCLRLKGQPNTGRAMIVASGFGYLICLVSFYSPNPYGLVGAYYVWVVFLCLFVSIAGGFQGDSCIAVASTFGFVVVLTLYYVLGCQKSQTVSKEEYTSIFKFSVMKFNKNRSKKTKRRSSGTSQVSRTSMIHAAKIVIAHRSKFESSTKSGGR